MVRIIAYTLALGVDLGYLHVAARAWGLHKQGISLQTSIRARVNDFPGAPCRVYFGYVKLRLRSSFWHPYQGS